MKTKSYLTAIALAVALVFSACNKTEPVNNDPNQTEEVGGTPIVFAATGLNPTATATGTRATVDGNWEGVSSVAVMVDGTVKEYTVTANDADNTSATLSSNDPHYWNDSYDNVTVTAWWPYTAGEMTMPDVVVKADQSTSEGFEGSDFISAEEQTVAYDNPTLTFTHRTARVTVNLTDYTEGLVSVKLTSLSTENDNPSEIVAYEYDTENSTYVALVAPQTVAEGTSFITCEFDNGRVFAYEMQNDAEWKAGEEYTYTVSLAAADPDQSYKVSDADGLLAWNEAVQYDNSLSCTLLGDIDMTGVTWSPVSSFSGTFNGNGYTITGLTVSGTSSVGLIGVLSSDGKVQNLTLENVSTTGTGNYTGTVVGRSEGTITNCSVSGTVSGASYAGGVVGSNDSGTLIACYSSCTVSGTGYVGGVAGENYNGTVTACYSLGSVSGSGNYVGGVVGYGMNTTMMTACYHATGSVSGGNSSYTGGVMGASWGTTSIVTACYWNGYSGNGIGDDRGTSSVTFVDGSDVTWSTAVGYMNDAIDTWNSENTDPDKQCDWKYELTDTLPTLTESE